MDINLLLALAWPSHLHHNQAHEWFHRNRAAGFATCPLTQLGFLRLSSNPRFTKDAASPAAALDLLARITKLAGHVFWEDSLSGEQAFPKTSLIVGHQQITDNYLVALTRVHQGIFATFDRSIPASEFVEIL